MTNATDLQFSVDTETRRYVVAKAGEQVGLIDYRDSDQVRAFLHTETDPSLQGQGVAGQLTRFALDDVRSQGLHVAPLCPYTARFISQHQEYSDLVARA